MSFFEDLFEGRRGGHHDRHRPYDHHDDDDHRHQGYRTGPPPMPTEARAPQVACGRCQAPVVVLPGFRFCPYCGGQLASAAVCAGCGAVRAPGAAFCASCGGKF